MKKNMGGADRGIRFIAALVIAALLLTERVGGVLAVILGVIGAAFLVTSVVGWCPVYLPFGMSTCKAHDKTAGT